MLLRERSKVAMSNLDNAFNCTSGGEGPARTALALIFHTSDSAGGNPVNGTRGVSSDLKVAEGNVAGITAELRFVSEVDVLEFTRAKISKFVQFNSPCVVARVVSLNKVIVGLEDSVAVEELFRGIGFAKLLHPLSESVLVDGFRESGKGQAKEEDTN